MPSLSSQRRTKGISGSDRGPFLLRFSFRTPPVVGLPQHWQVLFAKIRNRKIPFSPPLLFSSSPFLLVFILPFAFGRPLLLVPCHCPRTTDHCSRLPLATANDPPLLSFRSCTILLICFHQNLVGRCRAITAVVLKHRHSDHTKTASCGSSADHAAGNLSIRPQDQRRERCRCRPPELLS